MAIYARPRLALAVTLALAAGAFAVHPAAQRSAPTSGASLMIDFGAVGADGRPVPDLKVEELALRVDGKPRLIHNLDLIKVPGAQGGRDAAHPALSAPFATNVATESGRTLILVIDDESIRAGGERGMQDAASQFLAGLGPNDRVAIVTVPHGGMKVDLTSDFDKVKTTLSQITGQAPETESLNDAACRTRTDLQSIAGMLDSLSGGQGPVTVVFFVSTLTSSRVQTTMTRSTAVGPMGPLGGAVTMGACELQPEEFDKVAAAAAQARAHFYVIRPELRSSADLINPSGTAPITRSSDGNVRGSNSLDQGIADLAGVTGGEQYPLAGTGDNALIRVALETSSYYVVRFEPDDADRNGAIHKVELKSSRPGVTIRALPAVVIPSNTAAANQPTVQPRTMLGELRPYRDLALRTTALSARYQKNTSKIQILFVFEPQDPLATLSSAMAGVFDASGKLVSQWVASPADLTTAPMKGALIAAPGKYRLRIAATDKSGRSGATDYDIDATLTPAGPLKLSSLALGNTNPQNNNFMPKLQFTDEPVALAYLELYGTVPDGKIVVLFQVAKTADGPALLVQPASIDETSDPDRFIVEAAIPLANLEPGDYIVRAIVGAATEGQPTGIVTRTLRKTSK